MLHTAGLPGWQLSDEQVATGLAEALREKARIEAECSRLSAVAADRELPRLAGNYSITTWIANLGNISRGEAARINRRADAMSPDVVATQTAWATGELNAEQFQVIADAVNTLPDFAVAEKPVAEQHLLNLAHEFGLEDLKRLANHILEVIDPDGAEEHLGKKIEQEEKKALRATTLDMFNAGDGMTRGRFLIPAVQADILKTALEGIAAPRRTHRTLLDIDPDGDHSDATTGRLSHSQRLGRALLELIEHLPSDAMPQHGGLAATVTVNIDLETLREQVGTATLSTGVDVSAAQARRLACNANLIPMVLDGDSRILDLGMSKRLYDTYQRLALAKRDGGCCWKGCNRPPSWCESHHLTWHSRGGRTDVDNGALFCFYHHHLLHSGEWDARMSPDGVVEVIPPARIDPRQRPIRHQRHKQRQPLLV